MHLSPRVECVIGDAQGCCERKLQERRKGQGNCLELPLLREGVDASALNGKDIAASAEDEWPKGVKGTKRVTWKVKEKVSGEEKKQL